MTHDYFRYLPRSPASKPWGLAVTAAGFTEIKPGSPYPPVRHPEDHYFAWEEGRRLSALQIVSIQSGAGWFDSEVTGLRRIAGGTAFLVMPGIWHRYRPDPATGWTESWVEMTGPAVDRLIRAGVFRAERPFRKRAAGTMLDEALGDLHAKVRQCSARFDPAITAKAFEILAAWCGGEKKRRSKPRVAQKIIEAERYIATHASEPMDMSDFARNLGIAYSHFRKLFRDHTGYAPWAYVRRIRLLRARRLLLQTSSTLGEIAGDLGFSSAFHFSIAFKAMFGEPPSAWRSRQRRG